MKCLWEVLSETVKDSGLLISTLIYNNWKITARTDYKRMFKYSLLLLFFTLSFYYLYSFKMVSALFLCNILILCGYTVYVFLIKFFHTVKEK